MKNLLNDLKTVLEKDDRLVAGEHLLKNKIIEMALAMDTELIRLLLTHAGIRRHFFTDVGSVVVLEKIKFQHFVLNKAFFPIVTPPLKNRLDGRRAITDR